MKKYYIIIAVLVAIIIALVIYLCSSHYDNTDYNNAKQQMQIYEDSIRNINARIDTLMKSIDDSKTTIIYRDSVRDSIILRYEKEYIYLRDADCLELDSIIRANW